MSTYEEIRYEAEREAAEERYMEEMREQLMPELYADFARDVLSGKDDLYGQIIDQFASERLQSYYLANPRIAERALWALHEARSLLKAHPDASIVFAVAAAEVGLKSCLLKPILHGLVHDDAMAVIVTELIPRERNDKFQKILFKLLKEYGGIDLQTFKRSDKGPTLWTEIQKVQSLRNLVVHSAEPAKPDDADEAADIASQIIEKLFPAVISKLGLKVNANLEVAR